MNRLLFIPFFGLISVLLVSCTKDESSGNDRFIKVTLGAKKYNGGILIAGSFDDYNYFEEFSRELNFVFKESTCLVSGGSIRLNSSLTDIDRVFLFDPDCSANGTYYFKKQTQKFLIKRNDMKIGGVFEGVISGSISNSDQTETLDYNVDFKLSIL